jgi:hypothetical protein
MSPLWSLPLVLRSLTPIQLVFRTMERTGQDGWRISRSKSRTGVGYDSSAQGPLAKWVLSAFFLLTFSCRAKKKSVARRGETPASQPRAGRRPKQAINNPQPTQTNNQQTNKLKPQPSAPHPHHEPESPPTCRHPLPPPSTAPKQHRPARPPQSPPSRSRS